jgi:hypothetical protein
MPGVIADPDYIPAWSSGGGTAIAGLAGDPLRLAAIVGDTQVLRIPMRWENQPFDPTGFQLIFTAKRRLTDADADAVIQKTSSGGGITVSGSTALIPIERADTFAQDPGSLHWDIQADIGEEDVRTVRRGRLALSLSATIGIVPVIPGGGISEFAVRDNLGDPVFDNLGAPVLYAA